MPTLIHAEHTLRADLAAAAARLEQAGVCPSRHEAELLAAYAAGCGRMDLYLNPALTAAVRKKFLELVERRAGGEPLQYCTGIAWFYGLDFNVGPGAFIPRQETEILAQQAIHLLRDTAAPAQVLDLCCGPGTLGIALTKNITQCRITAIDSSPQALAFARANGLRHGVEGRISFILKDIRSMGAAEIAALPKADLMLCNPPYVPAAARSGLPVDVLREPWLALDGGADGLDFYRLLIPRWHSALRDGGVMVLEHGDGQAAAIADLMRAAACYERITHLRDLSGRERVVQATVRSRDADPGFQP